MILTTENIKQVIDDDTRIKHMLGCIEKIERTTKEETFERFYSNHVLRAAVTKWLEIIGEAAKYITEETKNRNPSIEWRKMIKLRNLILYKYFDIDYQAIWKAIITLKDLKTKLEAINLDLNDKFLTN